MVWLSVSFAAGLPASPEVGSSGWVGGSGREGGLAGAVNLGNPPSLPAGVSPFLRLCVDVSTEGKQGRGRASACLPVGLYYLSPKFKLCTCPTLSTQI